MQNICRLQKEKISYPSMIGDFHLGFNNRNEEIVELISSFLKRLGWQHLFSHTQPRNFEASAIFRTPTM
jgi:hypothetical protein